MEVVLKLDGRTGAISLSQWVYSCSNTNLIVSIFLGNARVATIASDHRSARVALATEDTAGGSLRADDKFGLVGVGFEELGVYVRLVTREYTVFAFGVLDDCDVC